MIELIPVSMVSIKCDLEEIFDSTPATLWLIVFQIKCSSPFLRKLPSLIFPPDDGALSPDLRWIRTATWAGFQLHPSIPKWHTEDAGSDGTQMAATLFIALPQLPEDIWKVPTLAVSSTRLSSHHAWFKDGWKQRAGLGKRDHVFYWQWLTEAQAVKPWVTFTEGTYLKPWHTCRCSEPASGTFIDAT